MSLTNFLSFRLPLKFSFANEFVSIIQKYYILFTDNEIELDQLEPKAGTASSSSSHQHGRQLSSTNAETAIPIRSQSQEDLFFDAPEIDESLWKEKAAANMSSLEESLRQLTILADRTESQERLLQDAKENWNSSNNF